MSVEHVWGKGTSKKKKTSGLVRHLQKKKRVVGECTGFGCSSNNTLEMNWFPFLNAKN